MFFEQPEGPLPGGEVFILNRLQPLEVYRLLNKDLVERAQVPPQPQLQPLGRKEDGNFTDLRLSGGKLLWLPELNEYLGVAHSHLLCLDDPPVGNCYYLHAFFTLSPTEPFHVRFQTA